MKASIVAGLVLTLSLCMLSGCGTLFPPQVSVLEGVWQLAVANNADLGLTYLTFNSSGNLIQVTIQNSQNVTTVVPTPEATVMVSGPTVTITASNLLSGNLNFTGTLNSGNTVVTGELTTTVTVGGLQIVINKGAATLTKVNS